MFVGACLLCACALSLAPTNVGAVNIIRYDIFGEYPGFKNMSKYYTLSPRLHFTGSVLSNWSDTGNSSGIDHGGDRWSFWMEVDRPDSVTIQRFSFRCVRNATLGKRVSFNVRFMQARHGYYVYRYDNIPITNATIADGTYLARDPPVNGTGKGCGDPVFEPVAWAKCGSNYVHATNGTLTSPFYPDHVPANLECVWQLTGPNGYHFVLTITDFKLGKQDCAHWGEYNLLMYNGLDATSPVLNAFCSTRVLPKANEEVTSQYPAMRVLFRTKKNSPNMKGGVRITYKREATSGKTNASDCYEPRGKPYTGTTNVTVDGWPCQRWDADRPYTIYPPEYRKYPENYCRNPSGDRPTCVSTKPHGLEWAYCDVPPCPIEQSKTSGAVQPPWVCSLAVLCVCLFSR